MLYLPIMNHCIVHTLDHQYSSYVKNPKKLNVVLTTTKGVPVRQVISLDVEQIHGL